MKREIRVNCPFCARNGKTPDRKRHLYIAPQRNVAHCFRCGYGTRNAKERLGELVPEITEWGTSPLEEKPSPKCRLPEEYSTNWDTTAGRAALRYLRERQITPTLISEFDIGFCETGSMAHRIIIPIYEDGALVSWQARDMTGRSKLKYMTPNGGHPNCLFNLDRAREHKVMVLVEGPFDVLALPDYAVGLLGKGWNDEKRRKILLAKPTVVFLALDQDAKKEESAIFEDLGGIVPIVRSLDHTAKDFGEAPREERRKIRELCEKVALAACGTE